MPWFSTEVALLRATLRGVSWNWTAIGTVALAVVTVVGLGVTIYYARRDRRDAEQRADRERRDAEDRSKRDREDAERRLREERQLSEQHLREERQHAAEVRRRDRQAANATELMRRVSELQPRLGTVPSLTLRERAGPNPVLRQDDSLLRARWDARQAIDSLRHGAWTEAAMLGASDAAREAAVRYRHLVRLVDQATLGSSWSDRDADSLSNFATWVRISLRSLAEDETVPPIRSGAPEGPEPQSGDESPPVWKPDPLPPDWEDESRVNPPIRRSSTIRIELGRMPGASGSPGNATPD